MNHMNLNAYVLAMAITGKFKYREEPQVVPEPEFKPFDPVSYTHLTLPTILLV